MERIFIKPNVGRNVRLENGTLLPREGAEVQKTAYIDRRILAEDAVIAKQSSEKKETKSKTN